jgi:hypothetical protein
VSSFADNAKDLWWSPIGVFLAGQLLTFPTHCGPLTATGFHCTSVLGTETDIATKDQATAVSLSIGVTVWIILTLIKLAAAWLSGASSPPPPEFHDLDGQPLRLNWPAAEDTVPELDSGPPEAGPFDCELCGKSVRTANGLKQHMRAMHS